MIDPLTAVALVAGVVVAAPVPKKPVKDYQKVADATAWAFPERTAVADLLADELKGYRAAVIAEEGESITVRITDDTKAELLKWETHPEGVFRQRDGVLYRADFHPHASGCTLVAFDLKAKNQLWRCELKGLGGIDHSKYFNAVRLAVFDDSTLAVFGNESAGRYFELVDRNTGKTVGNKVFEDEKK